MAEAAGADPPRCVCKTGARARQTNTDCGAGGTEGLARAGGDVTRSASSRTTEACLGDLSGPKAFLLHLVVKNPTVVGAGHNIGNNGGRGNGSKPGQGPRRLPAVLGQDDAADEAGAVWAAEAAGHGVGAHGRFLDHGTHRDDEFNMA